MSDKPLDEYEMAFQEFVIIHFNITKLSSMIYGVTRRKGKSLGYSEKSFNPRSETLSEPIESSSLSSV